MNLSDAKKLPAVFHAKFPKLAPAKFPFSQVRILNCEIGRENKLPFSDTSHLHSTVYGYSNTRVKIDNCYQI